MGDSGGLYLLIKSSGRYWRMNYRFAGKQKTLSYDYFWCMTREEKAV
ncbi:Arm DNA-binding domain-containing protein [Nitrosomonas marina]|nr:Arm DNA-binding domain-containing protein [Nitrosomonas marina]